MGPVFADKALTEAEIADLVAFLASVEGDDPPGRSGQLVFAGLGVGGLLVLLALMYLLIRGPNETYNERLRRRNG